MDQARSTPSGAASAEGFDWARARERLAAVGKRLDPSQALDPAERREILRQRAAELARPVAQGEEQELVDILGFRCGERTYGVAVESLDAVVQARLLPVPGLTGLHRGVINHQGAIITAVDAGLLIGQPPVALSDRVAVVILAADGYRLGLVADEVLGITPRPAADIHPLQMAEEAHGHGAVVGVTPDSWLLLDAGYLIRDARLVVDEEVAYLDPAGEGNP